MKYLRLFSYHSGYTEYMSGETVNRPHVAHCVNEDEVHYENFPVVCLPENEEVWALYQSLVCDDERLKDDLKNIFSKYVVSSSTYSHNTYYQGHSDLLYITNGYEFVFIPDVSDSNFPPALMGNGEYYCEIDTNRSSVSSQQYALASVTNDCGEDILPDGVGDWEPVTVQYVDPGFGGEVS